MRGPDRSRAGMAGALRVHHSSPCIHRQSQPVLHNRYRCRADRPRRAPHCRQTLCSTCARFHATEHLAAAHKACVLAWHTDCRGTTVIVYASCRPQMISARSSCSGWRGSLWRAARSGTLMTQRQQQASSQTMASSQAPWCSSRCCALHRTTRLITRASDQRQ